MKNPSSQSGRFRSRVLALNLVFVVAALAVARLPHAVAEQGQWTSNGPSTGGAVNTVAVDPRSANVVYAGGTLGLYKSFDGGKTWRPSEAGIPAGTVQTMAIDPSTPTTLFASLSTGAHGIYRSTDAGATWTIAGTGLPNSIVNAVAIHPLHASTIYLGNYNGVFRSGDGGATWVDVGGGLTSKAVLALALDAGDEN